MYDFISWSLFYILKWVDIKTERDKLLNCFCHKLFCLNSTLFCKYFVLINLIPNESWFDTMTVPVNYTVNKLLLCKFLCYSGFIREVVFVVFSFALNLYLQKLWLQCQDLSVSIIDLINLCFLRSDHGRRAGGGSLDLQPYVWPTITCCTCTLN